MILSFLKIVFKENYSFRVKFLIDFIILLLIYYFISNTIGLSIIYSKLVSFILYTLFPVIFIYIYGSYGSLFRYSSIISTLKVMYGLLSGYLIILFFNIYYNNDDYLNQICFFFIASYFLAAFRLIVKFLYQKINLNVKSFDKIMIFGAGNSGVITKRAFYNSSQFRITGFIDDDKSKINKEIDGVNVFKIGQKLDLFIKKNNIKQVIISTKKLSVSRKKVLYNYFKNMNVQLLKLPPVSIWIKGIPNISKLRELKIDELLSRGAIQIDNSKNKDQYNGKSILISGGAGSIGSEIIRQLIKFKPFKIIVLDNAETPVFNIQQELKNIISATTMVYYINSVTDEKVINEIFLLHDVDIVFHAAAYKHVHLMEKNPRAAVINNIYGSKLLIDSAIKFKIKKFVLISSDKAVNPTNVMGASKRISELYLASKFNDSKIKTNFMITRFGNVLASNGSVVNIFEKQIEKGGPVTITHPEIQRFFMTIPEASMLVIEAGTMGKGGEVFVFDMGDPVKIVNLAKNMITQKGFTVNKEILLEFIGLRPGEKLYEEVLLDSEKMLKTYNSSIYIAKKELVSSETSILIDKLINLSFDSFDRFKIVKLMKKIIPEYISNHSEYQALDKHYKYDKNIS